MTDRQQSPSLMETALLASIEKAVNAALRHDAASLKQLSQLSGRLVAIHLSLPPLNLYMLIVEDGVEFYHSSDASADVSVRGSPVDLAAQLLGWNTAPSVIGGPVSIQGDRELLQILTEIARQLDIDWGGLLSPILGDELAQHVDFGTRQFLGWARRGLGTLGRQLSDYLNTESALMPDRRTLREFYHEVDELRMETDRLEARIRQLMSGSLDA